MKKRIFVALVPPEEVKDALDQAARRVFIARARWVPKEQLHITVFFLGEVDELRILEITEKLEAVARETSPFSLRCKGIAYAPPGRQPTMLWAVFQESVQYVELAQRTRSALRSFTSGNEPKKPLAHITLARFEPYTKITPLPPFRTEAAFEASSLALMESQGGPNGSRYIILETFLFSS